MRAALLLLTLGSCTSGSETRLFPVDVRASFDTGEPVEGATVLLGNAQGRTDHAGRIRMRVPGTGSVRLPVKVVLPQGLRVLSQPKEVVLHVLAPLAGGAPQPQPVSIDVTVAPERRTYVVAVLTELKKGTPVAGLPVLVSGAARAATNEAGVAHVVYESPPGAEITVRLDTSRHPRLQPANPSMPFVLPDRDEALVFRKEFTKLRPPKRRAKKQHQIKILSSTNPLW